MTRLDIRARVWAIFALLVLSMNVVTFGQVVTGAILGRVVDTTGAVLAGATVQIQNVDTGFSRSEQADAEGRYLARNLPLGSYSVTAQQAGFQTAVRRGIVLTVASEVTVNMELAVGNVQETVEVTGDASAIETTNATLSGLVNADQIRDLPLNGRSLDSLTLLNPGVFASKFGTVAPFGGFGLRLSINGGRPDNNLYLLDGTVANDHSDNGPGSAAQASLGVEAILEFRVLTHNFSAEYGRNAGSVISMVTRSGTNEFHGSVYEFLRNNALDARNFFNPGALPPYRRNQFGAAAGGPIKKDKIFFFANYEGLRTRQGVTIISGVPTADARLGNLPTGKVTVNPKVTPYLNLYPLPNGRTFSDGSGQYISNFNQATNEDYSMERMDVRLSDKDNFYWRYVYDPSNAIQPRPVPIIEDILQNSSHYLVLSETHIFSGTTLNEFRAAFNRTDPGNVTAQLTTIDPSLSFVPGQPIGTIKFSQTGTSGGAGAASAGLSELGTHSGSPNSDLQNIFEENDTFSTIKGAHSLKFGVDVQRVQLNVFQWATQGVWTFGGLSALLTGTPSTFAVSTRVGNFGWRQILFGYFVQDDIRLRPNLTLNVGLRHEFYTSPNDVNGNSSALVHVNDPTRTTGPAFISQKLNFSPRLGLAWDPSGNGKTSVRLGAGVFYNQLNGRQFYAPVGSDPRFYPSFSVKSPVFPNQFSIGLPLNAQSTSAFQYRPQTPTVYQYNLEVQRQLAPSLSLRVGYVGSTGVHMARLSQVNTRTPQISPDGTKTFATTSPLLYSNFSSITLDTTDAHFNYNALQAVLQKNFSAGLQFQASYTYSKAMSDADEVLNALTNAVVQNTMDPYNLARDYSLSAYDQRQTFVLNARYEMPWEKALRGKLAKAVLGGWGVNGIFSYGSGLPFAVADGFNNSQNDGSSTADRPNVNPGFSNNPIHGVTNGCAGIPAGQQLHTPNLWFDPCAFSLSPLGTYGNDGRATVTAPGITDVDFSVIKITPIKERLKLEFRAEFFNLFNHAQFGLPALTLFSSARTYLGNAGSIVSTTVDNREIQMGLRLVF